MHFQRIIAKLVILAMLFTVTLSPVSATSTPNQNPLKVNCHSSAIVKCCESSISSPQHQSMVCNPVDMTGQDHASNCCGDNGCQANSIPLAILTDNELLTVSSSSPLFTEPKGERLYHHDLLLRPPLSA
ncbi:hypothetical protein [uncultured Photobacterium sp.]|uniref:hypothetical protein n=1 Tax=uncultured Photobacterium sp. TaxID=173973 RepID=UPI00260889D1|nr:hypothetical protein [uncultured Photobacterium sp.]